MNVGYGNSNNIHKDLNCPLCGADVYVSKYGNDFKCMNNDCELFTTNAQAVLKKIEKFLEEL